MNDIGPDGFGYYYRTSIDGRRIKAVYSDTEIRPVMDGPQRFAEEIKKWRDYLQTVEARMPRSQTAVGELQSRAAAKKIGT